GHRKPDPVVYRTLASRSGGDPEGILFVDDLEPNVEGARRAGMVGILFQGAESLRRELRELGLLP
ncbi:MAG: HAD-IA family hydrolase, partial [Planctomycetota bacterium]